MRKFFVGAGIIEHLRTLCFRSPFIGIVVVAVGLRFFALDSESLWVDEVAVVKLVRDSSLAELWVKIAHEEVHPPLYFVLVWGWVQLWGTSESALRSLSALWGSLAVFVSLGLAKRVLSPVAARSAVVASAIAVFPLAFAQEARMYALLLFLWLGVMYCWWRGVVEQNSAALGYATVLMIAALYTHPIALLLPLLWLGAARFVSFSRSVKVKVLPPSMAIVALLPWLWHWIQMVMTGAVEEKLWAAPFSWRSVAAFVLHLIGWIPPYPRDHWDGVSVILLCAAIVAGIALARLLLLFPTQLRNNWRIRWLAWWGFVPIGVVWFVSWLWIPLWLPRYLLIVFPPLVLFFAQLGEQLPKKTQRWVVWSLIMAALIFLVRYYAMPQKEQWREAVQWIEQRIQPKDALLFQPGFIHDAFEYYQQKDYGVVIRFPIRPRRLYPQDRDSIRQVAKRYSRIWYIESHSRDSVQQIPAVLGSCGNLEFEKRFLGIHIRFYQSAACDSLSPPLRD